MTTVEQTSTRNIVERDTSGKCAKRCQASLRFGIMSIEWLRGLDESLLAARLRWLAGGVIFAVGRNQAQNDRNQEQCVENIAHRVGQQWQ